MIPAAAAHGAIAGRWRVVGLLWVVGLLNYLDRVMLATMHGSIVAAIPMTEAQFGLLTTSFLLVYAVLSPFAGFVADRFRRSRVIVLSLFAWSALTWLTAHAHDYRHLLFLRALMGISEACYIPGALALIADYHGPTTRSLANGLHMSGIMVGSGLGGLGGWLAERRGWGYAFELFGLIGVGYIIVLLVFLRDPPQREHRDEAGVLRPAVELGPILRSLFAERGFVIALLYWSLLGLLSWAVIGWMPTYLREHFHLTQGRAGLSATGYVQFAALLGVVLGGWWADRWSRSNPRGPMLVPLVGLCVAAPAIVVASTTSVLPIALGGLAVYGLTRAFADTNMMPILSLLCAPRHRATGYGVLNFLSTAVGAAGIYIGGVLRDSGGHVTALFDFAAGVAVVCAVLLACIRPGRAAAK